MTGLRKLTARVLGLAAAAGLLTAAGGTALMGAPPANADNQKCSTTTNLYNSGYEVHCDIYGDDGSWTTADTDCDGNGNCTTNTN